MNFWRTLKQTLLAAGFLGATGSAVMAETFSDLPFDAACSEAAKSNKIVLVDFYTTWCGPCKLLDKNTWTDAAVQKLLSEKTVALRVDAEKETALAKKYKIEGYPTILLVKPDGAEIDRLVGYREPKVFISEFNDTLAGKDAVARAREAAAQAGTNDAMSRMKLGVALAQKGKDAEALQEYKWCFEHGLEATPGFSGVRLSYLLNYLQSLGKKYPPAQKQLEAWRDERQAALPTNVTNGHAVQELISLNNALGDEKKNLALYDELPADSKGRDMARPLLTDQFLKNGRYADVLPAAGAKASFDQQAERFNSMVKTLANDNPSKAQMQSSLGQYMVRQGAKYFEALAGLKRNDEAKELAADILKFDSSAETKGLLGAAAKQAHNAELEQYLAKNQAGTSQL